MYMHMRDVLTVLRIAITPKNSQRLTIRGMAKKLQYVYVILSRNTIEEKE